MLQNRQTSTRLESNCAQVVTGAEADGIDQVDLEEIGNQPQPDPDLPSQPHILELAL